MPGSTQYEARSLADQDKENLLTSEAVAQFLDRVWPRWRAVRNPCAAPVLADHHMHVLHAQITHVKHYRHDCTEATKHGAGLHGREFNRLAISMALQYQIALQRSTQH